MLVMTSRELALFMLALIPLIAALIWVLMFKARPMFERVQTQLDALNQVLQENLAGDCAAPMGRFNSATSFNQA